MSTNDFLPFCPTDTGTNLLSESDYTAATDRTIGNQPGVASSKLNNKALRQATYVVSQLAQYMVNQIGTDVLDDATPAKLLAQIGATFVPLAPVITRLTSGSGSLNLSYVFFIASGNATSGATYTNNGVTFTVSATVTSSLQVIMTGSAAPTTSGTLTKTSGTGDASITFYAMRAPLLLEIEMVGGGGGGGGAGLSNSGGNGSDGSSSSFSDWTANNGTGGGGPSGVNGGSGGSVTTGTGVLILNVTGERGSAGSASGAGSIELPGGRGGATPFGGSGANVFGGPGDSAVANTGSGGGGTYGLFVNNSPGGGGAGAYVKFLIANPSGTYSWSVGTGGAGGTAGSSGYVGGDGASGAIYVKALYQ